MTSFYYKLQKKTSKKYKLFQQNKKLNKSQLNRKKKIFKLKSKKKEEIKNGIRLTKKDRVLKNYLKEYKNLKIQKGGSFDILNLKNINPFGENNDLCTHLNLFYGYASYKCNAPYNLYKIFSTSDKKGENTELGNIAHAIFNIVEDDFLVTKSLNDNKKSFYQTGMFLAQLYLKYIHLIHIKQLLGKLPDNLFKKKNEKEIFHPSIGYYLFIIKEIFPQKNKKIEKILDKPITVEYTIEKKFEDLKINILNEFAEMNIKVENSGKRKSELKSIIEQEKKKEKYKNNKLYLKYPTIDFNNFFHSRDTKKNENIKNINPEKRKNVFNLLNLEQPEHNFLNSKSKFKNIILQIDNLLLQFLFENYDYNLEYIEKQILNVFHLILSTNIYKDFNSDKIIKFYNGVYEVFDKHLKKLNYDFNIPFKLKSAGKMKNNNFIPTEIKNILEFVLTYKVDYKDNYSLNFFNNSKSNLKEDDYIDILYQNKQLSKKKKYIKETLFLENKKKIYLEKIKLEGQTYNLQEIDSKNDMKEFTDIYELYIKLSRSTLFSISLEKQSSTTVDGHEFPDCGEIMLRNFIKILISDKFNNFDYNILILLGANSDSEIVKYFKKYDTNLKLLDKPIESRAEWAQIVSKVDGVIYHVNGVCNIKGIGTDESVVKIFKKLFPNRQQEIEENKLNFLNNEEIVEKTNLIVSYDLSNSNNNSSHTTEINISKFNSTYNIEMKQGHYAISASFLENLGITLETFNIIKSLNYNYIYYLLCINNNANIFNSEYNILIDLPNENLFESQYLFYYQNNNNDNYYLLSENIEDYLLKLTDINMYMYIINFIHYILKYLTNDSIILKILYNKLDILKPKLYDKSFRKLISLYYTINDETKLFLKKKYMSSSNSNSNNINNTEYINVMDNINNYLDKKISVSLSNYVTNDNIFQYLDSNIFEVYINFDDPIQNINPFITNIIFESITNFSQHFDISNFDNIKYVEYSDDINSNLVIPQYIETIIFNNNFLYIQNINNLPDSLKHLHLKKKFNTEILLPSNLETLILDGEFNKQIEIPESLKSLIIENDSKFNKELILPYNLQYLEINNKNTYNLNTFPENLKTLKLNKNFNNITLPQKLEELKLSLNEHTFSDVNILPNTLIYLKLNINSNTKINDTKLNSLSKLKSLSLNYIPNLTTNIKNKLTELEIYIPINNESSNILPDNYFKDFIKLRKLTLNGHFNQNLNNLNDSPLHELHIYGNNFNNELPLLPNTLKYLTLPYTYNKNLSFNDDFNYSELVLNINIVFDDYNNTVDYGKLHELLEKRLKQQYKYLLEKGTQIIFE